MKIHFDSATQIIECDYEGAKFSCTLQLIEDLEKIHGLKDAAVELLNLVAIEHKLDLSKVNLVDFKTRITIIKALNSLQKSL